MRAKRDDNFYTMLKSLVIPITVQSFMLALVSATDAAMLGLLDQTALSSVSLAGQIQFVLSLFISGISVGAGILVAQYWGKQDIPSIEDVMPVALRVNLAVGLLFTVAAFFFPRLLIGIFTGEPELIECGAVYIRAVSFSYLLCAVSQIYLILLKNTGFAGRSSLISSSCVVINIVLNALLIFGLLGFPAFGVAGAAYATVTARAIELAWSVFECLRPGRARVSWSKLFRTANRSLAQDFWHYTRPVLGASLVWGVAFSSYSVIMGHMGSDAVAANSITSIAKSLLSCLIRGVSGGAGVLIGNVLGAGKLDLAKEYGRRLSHLAIAVGIFTGTALIALSPVIVKIAPIEDSAAVYLQYMLIFCGINIMAQSVNTTVLDGIFCAGGDSKFDMIGTVFAMWCFSVPFGFLAAFALKLPVLAVYCIVNMDEIVKLPAVYLRYKKYIWVKNITREE